MKHKLSTVLFCATVALCAARSALGQEEAGVGKPKGYFAVKPFGALIARR